jgi:hypothetical protein
MPIPKRYFHCSQEIIADPEVWEFTSEFGDRALRTWLQILIYLERSDNQWRLAGEWLAVLSRTTRQSVANCSRQIRWLVAKEWLLVGESAPDGSPLVLNGRNWLKYNKTRGRKNNLLTPDQGADEHPLRTVPYHTVPIKNKNKTSPAPQMTALAPTENNDPIPTLQYDTEFEQFWTTYPRKSGGKKFAHKAWMKAKDRPPIEQILAVIEKLKQSEQWIRDNGQYIPHPSTWLNQGRWTDEPQSPPAPKKRIIYT